VLNKYAKQKKRRRNFSIDRRHHYEKILEEATERKGSGFFKKVFLIAIMTGAVFLSILVRQRMESHGKEYADIVRESHEEITGGKEKGKKKRK
jgi:hypothetical protein